MVLHCNLPCSGIVGVAGGKNNTSSVVFIDGGWWGHSVEEGYVVGKGNLANKEVISLFEEELMEGQKLLHAVTESHVFCLSGAESNLSLEGGFPIDGASIEGDDKASA